MNCGGRALQPQWRNKGVDVGCNAPKHGAAACGGRLGREAKSIDFAAPSFQNYYDSHQFKGKLGMLAFRRNRVQAAWFAWLAALCLPMTARAAFTHIANAPDQFNEPNLIGVNPYPSNPNPSVLETLYGEINLRRVDDSFDRAFRHTGSQATVKAVARFNETSIDMRLRYYNPVAGNSGTVHSFARVPPAGLFPFGYNTQTQTNNPILLSASGSVFELGLESVKRSHSIHNIGGQDMLVTFEIIGNAGHPNNQIGNYVLAWEYWLNDDLDFQDGVYELSGAVPVPEPASWLMAELMLAWLSRGRWRRR
jgi:hypothetical protein